MATVKFIVSKSGDRPPITMRLTLSNSRKIQTRVDGVLAYRRFWSDAKQTHVTKHVNPTELAEVNKINSDLAMLAVGIIARVSEVNPAVISRGWLASEISAILYPEKRKCDGDIPLCECVARFINGAATRIQPNTGKPVSAATIGVYRQLQRHLNDFARRFGDTSVRNLNKVFYDRFVGYLYGLGLKPNTVGRDIKNIKVVLNSLPLEVRSVCEFVSGGKCSRIAVDVENVYLSETELGRLADVELPTESLERVRDLFLLLAWTGCRFSDLGKLTRRNIVTLADGHKYFRFTQRKTDAKVTIPILPAARAVLDKYDSEPPAGMNNVVFNREIKRVCRLAGLTERVVLTRMESVTSGGGVRVEQVAREYDKCECVSVHTARRSFATNMYKRGMPTLMIMAITGHRTEEAFLKYIKVSRDENAERMMALFLSGG